FGDANDERNSRIGRFHDAVRRERRRHEDDGGVGAGFFHSLAHGVKYRTVQMFLAAFAGRDSADNVRAIRDGLFRVESAFLAGEALNNQAGFFIYEYAHFLPPASATTLSAASFMPSAIVKLNPESRRILMPCSTLVPSILITIGTLMPRSRAAATTPVASVSQRRMPPKMLMSIAFTLGSERMMRSAFFT